MNNLLYYPTILIPSNWLKKAIFLSDSISSICPHGFAPSEGLLESATYADMKYLESMNMYKFMRPEELYWEDFDFILEELKSQTEHMNLELMREKYNNGSPRMEIYKSKMDSDIIEFLESTGMTSKYNASLIIDEKLGLLYMSLLAQVISTKDESISLSTRNVLNKSILFKQSESINSDNYMKLILDSVPQPSVQSSLEDIIIFKRQYEDELLEYRQFLNEWFIKLTKEGSIAHVQMFRDEMRRFEKEIELMGKHSKIDIVFGVMETLLPILGANEYLNIVEQGTPEQLHATLIQTGLRLTIQKLKQVGKQKNNAHPANYIIRARKEKLL